MKHGSIKIVAVIAVTGLIATWWILYSSEVQFRLNEEGLGNPHQQFVEPKAARRSPSGSISESNALWLELEQSRAKKESLRLEMSNLQSVLEKPPRWGRSSLTHYQQQTNSPEERAETDAITAGKKQDIQALSQALSHYATDHRGEFPTSIEQLDSYVRQDNLSLTGSNQFDLVYNGTADSLTNFPLRSVAMLRERQPWLSPGGKWTRVYGMYGGNTVYAGWSKIVSSEDGFNAFESEYVVSPPTLSAIGQ